MLAAHTYVFVRVLVIVIFVLSFIGFSDNVRN